MDIVNHCQSMQPKEAQVTVCQPSQSIGANVCSTQNISHGNFMLQLLMSRSPPLPSRPGSDGQAPRTPTSQCCENGRPILTDPTTGQTICSCQYPASLLTTAAFSRMAGPAGLTAENMYGHYAASAAQLGGDPTALYPTMVSILSYLERPLTLLVGQTILEK